MGVSNMDNNREHYYTEVGIKIHQFRFSVRFPTASLRLGSSSSSASLKDDTNWKWIPQKSEFPIAGRTSSATSSMESVSFCPDGDMSAPPVPPRSGSPTNAPPSALPPYPSSTVSRRRPTEHESPRTRRICSYV
jgi:hypothetical protein